jgi:TolA-binding protein
MALAEASRVEEARRTLEAHLEEHPRGPREAEARLQLAHLLLEGKDPRGALKVLGPLLEAPAGGAGRDQALYLRAWCLEALAEGGPEAVDAAYRKLISEHPESPLAARGMVELAQRLLERKDHPAARELFERARGLLEGPERGRPEASPDLLERALFGRAAAREGSEIRPRALFQAARAWMLSSPGGERSGEEAAERFARLAADPRARAEGLREEALLRLGECRHRLGKYAEAAQVLKELLAEFPQGALRHEARFALGFALQFQDDRAGAVECFRKVAAGTQAPVAARAQYHIGECLVEEKRHREAAREFLAVAANFDFEGPWQDWVCRGLLGAGLAYQAAGDPEAARVQYEELVKRFPRSEEGKAAAKRLEEVRR